MSAGHIKYPEWNVGDDFIFEWRSSTGVLRKEIHGTVRSLNRSTGHITSREDNRTGEVFTCGLSLDLCRKP